MPARRGFYAIVDVARYDCAEGLRIRCMSQSPDILDLFLGQLEGLGYVYVGREELDAWWR